MAGKDCDPDNLDHEQNKGGCSSASSDLGKKSVDELILEGLCVRPAVDGPSTVASLRTLGIGAQQAAAGNDPRFAFLGYDVQYVHPLGDNTNPGTCDQPKRTASAAYVALANGGTIYVADGTKWSDGTEGLGLNDGQGVHICSTAILPKGFLAQKSVQFIGYGLTAFGQFGTQAVNVIWGKNTGGTERNDPGIWLFNTFVPITFEHIQIICDQPARMGIDYRRNEDLTVMEVPITNARREAGSTTFTLDLPSIPIISMARTSGIVTVNYQTNVYPIPRQGLRVSVNSGDLESDFPSNDYVVTASAYVGGNTFSFSYDQGSGTLAAMPAIGASYKTSGAIHDDATKRTVVEITSNSNEFPSTMYVSNAGTPANEKIVVADPYGGFNGRNDLISVDNIGTLRLQLRYASSSFKTMNDCILFTAPIGGEKFGVGPTLDLGDVAGGSEWSWYRRLYLSGSVTGDMLSHQSIARSANVLLIGMFAPNGYFSQLQMQDGGIYCPIVGGLGGTGFLTVDSALQDVGSGIPVFKALVCEYGGGTVTINNVNMADTSSDKVAVDLGGITGNVTVSGSRTKGRAYGPQSPPPVILNSGDANTWALETSALESRNAVGWYGADGRLAGKRTELPGAFGVVQYGGHDNKATVDISTWSTVDSITVTPNQSTVGLDTLNVAYKLQCTDLVKGKASVFKDCVVPTAAENDKVLFGCWIKPATLTSLSVPNAFLVELTSTAGTPIAIVSVPFGGDGEWQWITSMASVAPNPDFNSIRIKISAAIGHDLIVYMPTLLYLPIATYSANEAARIFNAFRPVPSYLGSGCAGTMAGMKLIGHGGLGTAARYVVGGASGQITLGAANGNAIEIFNESGTSLGVLPLYAFTVNP